jgi:hypothetical protein
LRPRGFTAPWSWKLAENGAHQAVSGLLCMRQLAHHGISGGVRDLGSAAVAGSCAQRIRMCQAWCQVMRMLDLVHQLCGSAWPGGPIKSAGRGHVGLGWVAGTNGRIGCEELGLADAPGLPSVLGREARRVQAAVEAQQETGLRKRVLWRGAANSVRRMRVC